MFGQISDSINIVRSGFHFFINLFTIKLISRGEKIKIILLLKDSDDWNFVVRMQYLFILTGVCVQICEMAEKYHILEI